MAKVTVLREKFDGSRWKWLFADELIRACPQMNPDAADEFADSEFLVSRGTDPAVAAALCATRILGLELPRSTGSNG